MSPVNKGQNRKNDREDYTQLRRNQAISGVICQKHKQIRVFSPTDLCVVPFLQWTQE